MRKLFQTIQDWFRLCLPTKDIKISVVKQLLEPDYLVLQLFVNPEDVGHAGVARPRTYIYCCNKKTCNYRFDVFEAYATASAAIKGTVRTRPGDYLVATAAQKSLSAMQTAQVRGITYRHAPRLHFSSWFVLFSVPIVGGGSGVPNACCLGRGRLDLSPQPPGARSNPNS